jgi:hypothetical protein
MSRLVVIIGAFLGVYILETSFVASLPEPLLYYPLVVTIAVYLVQRFGLMTAGWWIVLEGFFLDFYGLAPVPFSIVAYVAGAIIVVAAFRSLFSNRSFYGVVATTITTIMTISVLELLIFIVASFFQNPSSSLSGLFIYFVWRLVLAVTSLFLIYPITEWVFRVGRFVSVNPSRS